MDENVLSEERFSEIIHDNVDDLRVRAILLEDRAALATQLKAERDGWEKTRRCLVTAESILRNAERGEDVQTAAEDFFAKYGGSDD